MGKIRRAIVPRIFPKAGIFPIVLRAGMPVSVVVPECVVVRSRGSRIVEKMAAAGSGAPLMPGVDRISTASHTSGGSSALRRLFS